MARTYKEIKRDMTSLFMASPTMQEVYGTSGKDVFEDTFSAVSVENILFSVVATCVYVLEVLFDRHKAETDRIVANNIVATIPWYYAQALKYQHGDALILDESTLRWGYAVTDSSKRVIKYAAVRDRDLYVEILVSGDKDGRPEVLSDEVRTAFEAYMNKIKLAGVVIKVYSRPADKIQVYAKVTYDPIVMDSDGKLLSDKTTPVKDSINAYLRGIVYGGTFNKTRLVDAIQKSEGVIDVELTQVKYSMDNGKTYQILDTNNYSAVSGAFEIDGLDNSIIYVQG